MDLAVKMTQPVDASDTGDLISPSAKPFPFAEGAQAITDMALRLNGEPLDCVFKTLEGRKADIPKQFFVDLAKGLEQKGKFQAARRCYKIIGKEKSSQAKRLQQAMMNAATQANESARKAFEEKTLEDALHLETELKNYESARALYEKITDTNVIAQRNLGELYLTGKLSDTEDFDFAFKYLYRAARNKDVKAFGLMGRLLVKMKEYERARLWFEKAITESEGCDEDYTEAVRRLGKLYLEGKLQGGFKTLWSESAFTAGNMRAAFDLGLFYLDKGEPRKARSYFTQVILHGSKGLRLKLAAVYLTRCEFEKVVLCLNEDYDLEEVYMYIATHCIDLQEDAMRKYAAYYYVLADSLEHGEAYSDLLRMFPNTETPLMVRCKIREFSEAVVGKGVLPDEQLTEAYEKLMGKCSN
tara:strand:- start:105697 stop:106935 length:1239 start_codon:yes stop_codon:yes gene_type:complete